MLVHTRHDGRRHRVGYRWTDRDRGRELRGSPAQRQQCKAPSQRVPHQGAIRHCAILAIDVRQQFVGKKPQKSCIVPRQVGAAVTLFNPNHNLLRHRIVMHITDQVVPNGGNGEIEERSRLSIQQQHHRISLSGQSIVGRHANVHHACLAKHLRYQADRAGLRAHVQGNAERHHHETNGAHSHRQATCK